MQFISQLKIKLFSKLVGVDEFGNSYYQDKSNKRFVVYKGIAEPSKIPPHWHCWIHYSSDVVPSKIDKHKYSWQKIHLPNLTGTKYAYSPKDFKPRLQKYDSWKPNS